MMCATAECPTRQSARKSAPRLRKKSRVLLEAQASPSPPPAPSQRRRKPRQEEEFFEVESILDERIVEGQKLVLIKWLHFPETSWEPIECAKECQDKLAEFYRTRTPSGGLSTPPPSVPSPRKHDKSRKSGKTKKSTRPPVLAQSDVGPSPSPPRGAGGPDPAPVEDRPLTTTTPASPHSSPYSDIDQKHSAPTECAAADTFFDYLTTPTTAPSALPVFTEVPALSEFESVLHLSIKRARRIPAGPLSSWKPSIVQRWRAELVRLSSLFTTALSHPTPLALFVALFEFVCAPGCVLAECFENKQRKDIFSTADDTVNAALRRLVKGQERKALRTLCSNGVAAVDPPVVAALKALHPRRAAPLEPPPVVGPQLVVDEQAVHTALFSDAADCNLSKDVFGWAPWMLFPWRGEKEGFFVLLVRFVCLIINKPDLFPPVCGLLLASGALTPLFKLSAAERLRNDQAGLPPRLRPINSGSLLAKLALSAALQTPAAERAAARVRPHQLSLGTPRGIERMVHTCRAAFASGYLVGRNDFANGFNSLSRQNMLGAASRLFPEGTSLLNLLYGVDAPVYLLDSDSNLTTLWSEEGPRQGCAAGTFLFCLGVAPLVSRMQEFTPTSFLWCSLTTSSPSSRHQRPTPPLAGRRCFCATRCSSQI